MRYKGGVISATPPTTSTTSAVGVWTLAQQLQAQGAGNWPTILSDQYFKYVTMLLHGDGTNGAQNNTFLDSSTNNFSITRNGNATQGTFSPYGSNWSNYFDGSSQLTAAANTAFVFGTGDFCIEGYFYVTADSPSSVATIVANTAGGNNGWILSYYNGGFRFQATGILLFQVTSSLNNWHHVVVCRASGVTSMFIDGVRQGTTSTAYTWSESSTLGVGYRGADAYFNGYISNLRLVKGSSVYDPTQTTITVPTAPLTAIANTSLLTCQSNRFIDNSTNAFAITVNGSPSVQRFSPFSPSAAYSTSTIGGSGYFDGSGDSLSIADDAAWNMGSGNFTAECWIYPTSFANEAMIMGQWSGATGGTTLNWALMFDSGSAGYLRLITSSNGSSVLFDLSTSTFALSLNTWQHIAAVRNGNTYTIYVNGISRATTTNASALYDATNAFTIGVESTSPIQYFQGYISDIRIVKGTAVYTSAFTPPTAPLTAITNTSLLTNFTNGGIFDNAMMNNLETVGNAQISTTQSKFGGSSMYFNSASAPSYAVTYNANAFAFGTGDLTIEGWIYPTQYTSNSEICTFRVGGNIFFVLINGGNLCIITNGYSPSLSYSSFGAIGLNTWTYIAITRVSGTWYGYINGVKSANSYSWPTSLLPTDIRVGEEATNRWVGYIDDLRITKGVARYTTSFTPPTAAFPNQ
jgi:hypothetical protein